MRSHGYALDDQEKEVGVRCVAVPVGPGPTPWMAVSVSGPVTRMTDERVGRETRRRLQRVGLARRADEALAP